MAITACDLDDLEGTWWLEGDEEEVAHAIYELGYEPVHPTIKKRLQPRILRFAIQDAYVTGCGVAYDRHYDEYHIDPRVPYGELWFVYGGNLLPEDWRN